MNEFKTYRDSKDLALLCNLVGGCLAAVGLMILLMVMQQPQREPAPIAVLLGWGTHGGPGYLVLGVPALLLGRRFGRRVAEVKARMEDDPR